MTDERTCVSPLATRPVLYTDTVGGKQTCRDDLWAVTTEELNEIERLKAQLEVATAGYLAAVSKAQWQASTNREMNRLSDELRKLKAEYTKLANERIREGL